MAELKAKKKPIVSKDVFTSEYKGKTRDGKEMERFTIEGYVSRSRCWPATDKDKQPIMGKTGKPLHKVLLVIKDKDKNEHMISFTSGHPNHDYNQARSETKHKYWVARVSGEQFTSDKGNLIQYPREVSVMQIEREQQISKNRDALAEAFLNNEKADYEPEVSEAPAEETKEAPVEIAFDEPSDTEEPAFDEADLDEDVLGRF